MSFARALNTARVAQDHEEHQATCAEERSTIEHKLEKCILNAVVAKNYNAPGEDRESSAKIEEIKEEEHHLYIFSPLGDRHDAARTP